MMPRCCLHHTLQLWLGIWSVYAAYVGANILVFSASGQPPIRTDFLDNPARFGGFIPADGVKGMLVYANPPTACVFIDPPPNITDYIGKWIVLIARYNCTFEEKVRMAQASGYDAAIVHNVGSDDLESMSAQTSMGITIPSVFVGQETGYFMKDHYLYYDNWFILINDDLPFNINTHLLLPFAIVVGICFLVMVIFMVIKCMKDRRRQRRHRLPNSSLKKIPTHKYTKGDPYETCAICLEDYAEGEKLRVLPCAHAYHTKCIDPWLTKNRRVCPVCKRKVFAVDERASSSESDSDADDATPLIRNGHQGTQGGTFTPQAENPFTRARQSHERRESTTSSGSYNSFLQLINSDDGDARTDGDSSEIPAFLFADAHSINGEPVDLERSASSTKPHTVNLEVSEHMPTVPLTPQRNPRILVNPVAPNSGHPIIVPNALVPMPTILPDVTERNDFVA